MRTAPRLGNAGYSSPANINVASAPSRWSDIPRMLRSALRVIIVAVAALSFALAVPASADASTSTAPSKQPKSVVAPYGVASCDTWTQDNRAFMSCNIKSGEFRVRADCKSFPDLYSPWFGKGAALGYTGKCPFGIRGAILEGR